MSIKFNGTTGYLEIASKLVTSYPYTLIAWASRDSGNADMAIAGQSNLTTNDHAIAYFINANASMTSSLSGSNPLGSAARSVSVVNPNATMRLMMIVLESPTVHNVYYGSASFQTALAISDNTATHNTFTIGAKHSNSLAPAMFLDGRVAEVHGYNVALTASDFTNLSADTVKPESISGWVDGWMLRTATDLTSIGGTRTLTAVGGVTTGSSHPIARAAAPDTAVPTVIGAAVANATPTFVDFTMSEAMDTAFTPAASSLTISGHTVSALAWLSTTVLRATVSAGFAYGEAVRTAAYTQPGTNNARDVAGNLLENFTAMAITNNVAATDNTAPSFVSAQVSNIARSDIVITMSETLAAFTPAASALAASGGRTVNSVSRSGQTITATVSPPYAAGDVITITYTKPGVNQLRDAAGNESLSFGPSSVTNNILATQPTFTPAFFGKGVNTGLRASVACRVAVYNLTSDALVGVAAGLVSTSAGLPPPFQLSSGAVAGQKYLCKVVADANNEDLGFFLCIPA